MSDAHAVARDQLRSFIERIERLEEEKKTIADDIKDVYGEAKGVGFIPAIIREIIKLRKQDKDERAEREALLDTYMAALGMIPEPDDDEPRQTTPVQRQPAMALRSDLGLNIQTKHTDIRSGGLSPAPSGLTTRPAEESVVPHSPETATQSLANRPCEAVSERTATQVDASASAEAGVSGQPEMIPATSAESAGEAAGNASDLPTNSQTAEQAGGEHEVATGNAERVPTSNTGEGAANTALPAKPKFVLRPYCRNPGEACGGSGTTHCHSCLKAREEVAA